MRSSGRGRPGLEDLAHMWIDREVVPDGEAGILCEVGDVEGMGDAALWLLSDPERWQQASDAARAVAVERFSSDLVVPQYEQYYRHVIERGAR